LDTASAEADGGDRRLLVLCIVIPAGAWTDVSPPSRWATSAGGACSR